MTLYTHHHYGWRKHELPNSHHDHLIAALLETHDFLAKYEGQYRVEIERTPALSFDGKLAVFWDGDEPYSRLALRRGDYWFTAFEFNEAPDDACRYCGGTGMDHYIGPFFHCWACDGTRQQIRPGTFRGFKHKPTEHCPAKAHEEYEQYLEESRVAAAVGGSHGG